MHKNYENVLIYFFFSFFYNCYEHFMFKYIMVPRKNYLIFTKVSLKDWKMDADGTSQLIVENQNTKYESTSF